MFPPAISIQWATKIPSTVAKFHRHHSMTPPSIQFCTYADWNHFLFVSLACILLKKNKFDKIIKKVKSFVTGILSLMSQLQQNFRYFCIKFSWHHNPFTRWTCPWSNKLRSTPHLPLWDKSFDVIEAIVHIFTNSDRFSSNYLKFLTLHVSRRHHRHSLL